ncbi:MAG: hypothetical protein KDC26_01675 [Armatimonadetes bacterium]|nr:hypothetical protein [Armatimonadota bacterium]
MRSQSVRKSMKVSLLSKTMGALIQLIGLPIAAHHLGKLYGVYGPLASLMLVVGTVNLGVGPGLSQRLSGLVLKDQEEEERQWFSNAFYLTLWALILILIIGLVVALFVPIDRILGNDFVGYRSEGKAGLIAVVVLGCIQNLFSAFDGAYIGLLEDYKVRFYNAIGYGLSLLALVIVPFFPKSLPLMLFAVFGTAFLPKLISSYRLMMVERPYLRPRWADFAKEKFSDLISSNMAFTLCQMGDLGITSLGIILVANLGGTEASEKATNVIYYLTVLATVQTMITGSVWPAMSNAWRQGDIAWFKRVFRKAVLILLGAGTVFALGLATVGEPVIGYIFKNRGPLDGATTAWMGVAVIITFIEMMLVSVFMSIGKLWDAAGASLTRGLLGLVLAGFLYRAMGMPGFVIGIIVARSLSLGWMWMRYQKHLSLAETNQSVG